MGTDASDGTGKAIRRRGIMAAAAVVAGLAAKQTAQPVAAGVDTEFYASGGGGSAFHNTLSYYEYGVNARGTNTGVFGDGLFAGVHGYNASTSGSSIYGVLGEASAGYGVSGVNSSTTAAAVYGQNTSGVSAVGVRGYTGTYGIGVFGQNTNGTGVRGEVTNGYGVNGISANGSGVRGESTGGVGVQGIATTGTGTGVAGTSGGANGYGVSGVNTGGGSGIYGVGGIGVSGYNGGSGYGVLGTSTTGIGVLGRAAQYGVVGTATNAGSYGIYGLATADGSAGFAGGTSNPNAYAAVFGGRVVVNGSLAVTGAKSAAVRNADGSHSLLYCVESPEAWFEDFGEGKLVAGRAEVRLDPAFAGVVDTSSYHVFVTPYDDLPSLGVRGRGVQGFAVEADAAVVAARGRRMTDIAGTFAYRIVARRKDVQAGRLARVQLPPEPGRPNLPEVKLPDPPVPPMPPALANPPPDKPLEPPPLPPPLPPPSLRGTAPAPGTASTPATPQGAAPAPGTAPAGTPPVPPRR